MKITYQIRKRYYERCSECSELIYEYDEIANFIELLTIGNLKLLERHTIEKKQEGIVRYKYVYKLPDGEDKCGKYESFGIVKCTQVENIKEE